MGRNQIFQGVPTQYYTNDSFLISLLVLLALSVEACDGAKDRSQSLRGRFFPAHWRDNYQMKREGIYGVQTGGFIADRWEIEDLGYVNHFQFERSPGGRGRAFIWEAGPSVNFYTNLLQNVFPYVTVNIGSTGQVRQSESEYRRCSRLSQSLFWPSSHTRRTSG